MPNRRISLFMAALALSGSGLTPGAGSAEAAEVRWDTFGTLGGPTVLVNGRLADTVGLPLIGRSAVPGRLLWHGFWFPRAGEISSVPQPPSDDAGGHESVWPVSTRFVGTYPNPIGPLAELRFEIAGPGRGQTTDAAAVPTRLDLFDINGRLAATILDQALPPGTHSLSWRAGLEARTVPNGVYFLRFHAGDHLTTHRIVVVR